MKRFVLTVVIILIAGTVYAGAVEEQQLRVALLQEKSQRLQMEYMLVQNQLKQEMAKLEAMPKAEKDDNDADRAE